VDTIIDPPTVTSEPSAGAKIAAGQSQVHYKGKNFVVPSVPIEGRTVVTTGRWLKVAAVREEELLEGNTVEDLSSFVRQLKTSGLRADLFTFAQRLPNAVPRHKYSIEWSNVAAIPITTYDDWLKNRAEYSVRKGVNRAKKLGVTVQVVEFSDALVEGITSVYNETPVRQGKAFWHYQKDITTVRESMATYLDRSIFLGAYYQNRLVGFMKCTYVNSTLTITQILSMKEHFDKKPNNALIAKAIELCEAKGQSHFIYGDFTYFDPNSSLTEFKRRLGFERIDLPRYYIPLTLLGRIALRMGFHRELARQIPQPMLRALLRVRTAWYHRRAAK
jgi:hypothetical protein